MNSNQPRLEKAKRSSRPEWFWIKYVASRLIDSIDRKIDYCLSKWASSARYILSALHGRMPLRITSLGRPGTENIVQDLGHPTTASPSRYLTDCLLNWYQNTFILGPQQAYPLNNYGEQLHASCCTFGGRIWWMMSHSAVCCSYLGGRSGFVDAAAEDYRKVDVRY